MPSIPFARSSYERGEGNLPSFRSVNMVTEKGAGDEYIAQSRPALDDRSANMGAGPVKALFRRDGVFGGDLFGVSAGSLYRGTTALGSVTGSGFTSIAGNEIGVMVTAGSTLRYYNGTTLADVAFPDGAAVAHVFAGGSRFWFIRKDTGKIYWTDALEADVESLDFATAESLPDKLLQGLWLDGMAILFGSESVELWQQTGTGTLPIKPMANLVYEKGLKATGCAAPIGSTFAWVGNDNAVYMTDEKTTISNEGLNARIAASTNVSLFSFSIDGVDYLGLRLDDETQVFRLATGTWHEFATYGQTNWVAACHDAGVFGSAVDGKTLAWGTDKTDALATDGLFQRIITAGFSADGGVVNIDRLILRCNAGHTDDPTTDPQVEMRFSEDGGKTWFDWEAVSLGEQGQYAWPVEWGPLGGFSFPGFLCEFRCSDAVAFRVSDVLVNEIGSVR